MASNTENPKDKHKKDDEYKNDDEHQRDKLAKFIKDVKIFSNEEQRKKAEQLYTDLLTAEGELRKIQTTEFVKPQKRPTTEFNLAFFSTNVGDNLLTKALKEHFVKGKASEAAWEYMTLKQSHDKLQKLKEQKPDKPEETGAPVKKETGAPVKKENGTNRRDNRFTNTPGDAPNDRTGAQATKGVHTTTLDIKNSDAAKSSGKMELTASHSDDIEMAECPPEDDNKQDDSKILNLLWTHQEYFDQRALSKAQAEYNYYRVLERQWKQANDRVNLEAISYPKFSMKMFKELPKNRPLYAVILTILEQSKDNKSAEAAAEEYHRMSFLEKTMFAQKIATDIPQGIELESAHYNELYQDMRTRFKSSGNQAQMRQAGEFKMIPLFDYLKLKETITQQRRQIDELASRLSGIASQQLAEGDAGFTDLGDKNRPQKLGERFAELFDETWSSAYESLRPKKEGEEEESDEATMNLLQSVVKVIYEFCLKVSQDQIDRIIGGMIPPIIDPMNTAGSRECFPPTEAMRTKTEHMAKEYRKVVAPATIKVLQKEIYEKQLKDTFLKDPIGTEVDKYVQQCVDLIWYMCIQQPAMEIVWAKPGEKFNREQFRFSGKKGKTYKLTVWPAVFLHKDGPLVAPGYAVPE